MRSKQLKDIIRGGVVGLSPAASVNEALRLMREYCISCVVVLDEGIPQGIFTEKTVLQTASLQKKRFLSLPLRDVMSSPALTLREDALEFEAYNLLGARDTRHLVVVDAHGRAVGVLTHTDLLTHLGFEYFVEVKKVSHLMSRDVVTVPEDCLLKDALALMVERSISCLVVAAGGRAVGILTERDLARALLSWQDIRRVTVRAVMSSPVSAVRSDTTVFQAVGVMWRSHIRRLAVEEEDGALIGLITQHDIVRGMEDGFSGLLEQIFPHKDMPLMGPDQTVEQTERRLERILRSAVDIGVVAVDLHLRIVYCNPKAEEMLSYSAEAMLGRDAREIHFKEGVDPSRLNRGVEAAKRGGSYEFEFARGRGKKMRRLQGRLSGVQDEGKVLSGFVLLLQDITSQKKAEEAILHMAYHDMLTGLPNRSLLSDRLGMDLAKAERGGAKLALLLLDLDGFKHVNDTLGHSAGDKLLIGVAQRFKALLRKTDTVARLGGDEFMFLLPEIRNREDAEMVAENVMRSLLQPFSIDGVEVVVACSIGIAMYPEHGADVDTLMRKADQAMYRAKEIGRGNQRSNSFFSDEPAEQGSED